MIALVWIGCTAGEPAPVAAVTAADHFVRWEALVAASARGDMATTEALARDLGMGSVTQTHAGATAVGAALGFLQVASDPPDLILGVERSAHGCKACHRARRASVPKAPAPTHATAAALAYWGVAWDQVTPPLDPSVPSAVHDAWRDPLRISAVLGACQGCHGPGAPASPGVDPVP